MIISKRRPGCRLNRSLITLLLTLACLIYLLRGSTGPLYISTRDYAAGTLLRFTQLPKANSTLGFGAIAAVSKTNSTRRDGLLLAANITGLEITIPDQQTWTDDDIMLVKAREGSLLTRGSALAWLGHLNLLNWFLSTDLETVLILEDDVDWDIHLRTTQVPRVAATVRHLLTQRQGNAIRKAAPDPAAAGGYWGNPSEWDILYLGHCGDAIKPGKWNFRVQRASFYDSTLPPRGLLEKKTRKMLNAISMPEDLRTVHQSIEPLCTFGFALTRDAAKMLLYDIALREPDGGVKAYDVRVLEACRDLGFRCWSSTPELFHHMHRDSLIAGVDNRTKSSTADFAQATDSPWGMDNPMGGHPSGGEKGSPAWTATGSYGAEQSSDDLGPSTTQDAQPSSSTLPLGTELVDSTTFPVDKGQHWNLADEEAREATQDTSKSESDEPLELSEELSQELLNRLAASSHTAEDPGEEWFHRPEDDPSDEEDDEQDVLSMAIPRDPRMTKDKAPNIACGARWFKARDDAELAMLKKLVGEQGRCIHQREYSDVL